MLFKITYSNYALHTAAAVNVHTKYENGQISVNKKFQLAGNTRPKHIIKKRESHTPVALRKNNVVIITHAALFRRVIFKALLPIRITNLVMRLIRIFNLPTLPAH